MWPYLFEIPGVPIYSYAVLHMLAVAALALFGGWWLRRKKAVPSAAFDAAVVYPFAMFLFAHIAFCLVDKGFTVKALRGMADIAGGGMWGGLIFLIGWLAIYALMRRFHLWTLLDLLSPAILLSLGIGKIGCLLSGCCWGGPSSFGLRLHERCPYTYPQGPLHPVPLYDALWAGVSLLILVALSRGNRRPGTVFLAFVVLYSAGRFMTEFLRYSYQGRTGIMGLYASQLVEAGSIVAAVCLLLWIHLRRGRQAVDGEAESRNVRDSSVPEGSMPAALPKRILAFCMDLIPSGVLLAMAVAFENSRAPLLAAAGAAYLLVFAVLPRTPSQFAFGMVIVNWKRERAGLLRRLLRAVCVPLPFLSLVGILRPLASNSRQTFYDMAAGVNVVTVSQERFGSAPPSQI